MRIPSSYRCSIRPLLLALAGLVLLSAEVLAAPAPHLRAMILDGESNPWHDWRSTTPMLERMLEQTGLFKIDVVTAPTTPSELSHFVPDFSRYQVVILNYDAPDGRWPPSLQRAFERYVQEGGGIVFVHAANNAFPGWPAFNAMAGVGGWRDRNESAGPHWYLDDAGRLVADHSAGEAGSHGRRLPFQITVRADHPVTRGLPQLWMHAGDELYATLRGPGRNMTVLASAWSDPGNQGSGRHEPMLMALSYGKGRIFHTTLGHDPQALAAVDFVVTFQRGCEWSATGEVTQPVPADYPSHSVPRLRADLLLMGEAPEARGQR
jgi:hypothetical protein